MKPGFYPEQLPAEILDDPKRDAEVKTFNALKEGMPKDYHVFYSCDWLDTRPNPVPSRDGECDFIIAHEELGILFIEVKGGELGRDGQTGEWYRKLGDSRKPIKDPVKQARTSKHVTLQMLQEHWPKSRIPYLRLRHGVILPHSSKPRTSDYLGAHMPLSLFAFKEDMGVLPSKMLMMLLEKEGELENNYGKLGSTGTNLLHKFFTSSFEFTSSLGSVLDAYDKRISGHTTEQQKILEFTSLHQRALILGGAGTGKTFLAHAKAREFAGSGLNTLLLYFNTPVATEAKRLLGELSNLTVCTFHELCGRAARNASIEVDQSEEKDLFDRVLPSALESAVSSGMAQLFDAIIIDEAQDLKETWIETLLLCLSDLESGKVFVFADDNQNLYRHVVNLSKVLECSPLTLPKNVRNTDQIFNFARNFYEGITLDSCSCDGPEIRFEVLRSNMPAKDLMKFLRRLRDVDGIEWGNIAVLSLLNREKSSAFMELEPISVLAGEDSGPNKLTFDSVWRFKGLERQVVVVIDIEHQSDNRNIQYVAATRARTLLVFAGSDRLSSRYQALLSMATNP